jgi:hypothetical protein
VILLSPSSEETAASWYADFNRQTTLNLAKEPTHVIPETIF